MEFPKYVPQAVREYLSALLDGKGEIFGLRAKLAEKKRTGADGAALKQLEDRIACVERLAADNAGVREAYEKLGELGDAQACRLIEAAFEATGDYSQVRKFKVKRKAAKLVAGIEKTATHLAGLLRDAQWIADKAQAFPQLELAKWPDALTNASALLRAADRVAAQGVDAAAGEPSGFELVSRANGYVVTLPRQSLGQPNAADSKASTADLLDALATVALGFKPELGGMLGAAIESRQNSPEREYIRALAHRLPVQRASRALSPELMHAMALVATVALDTVDPLTYDDVRQALKPAAAKRPRPGKKRKARPVR